MSPPRLGRSHADEETADSERDRARSRTRSAYEADRFARAFTAWVEAINPARYDRLWEDWLPEEPLRVLDLGCGAGNLALHMSERGGRVVGLDVSASMLEIAERRRRRRGVRNVALVRGDLAQTPFAPASFDLVVADASLHDADAAGALPGIRDLVSPGGTLIIRDVVTRNRRRDGSPLFQLLGACRRFPGHARRLGLGTALSVARFEMSPAWIRYRAGVEWMSPEEFEALFRAHLPGCAIVEEAWEMTAIWRAPTT